MINGEKLENVFVSKNTMRVMWSYDIAPLPKIWTIIQGRSFYFENNGICVKKIVSGNIIFYKTCDVMMVSFSGV